MALSYPLPQRLFELSCGTAACNAGNQDCDNQSRRDSAGGVACVAELCPVSGTCCDHLLKSTRNPLVEPPVRADFVICVADVDST